MTDGTPAAAFKQRLAIALRLPVAYRRLAIVGWLFYAISWLTPSIDARQLGAEGFVATVKFALALLAGGRPWGVWLGVCVCFGWLANVSIFTKWPTWGRAVWIAAPWFTFVVVLMTLPVRPSLPQRAAFFLYFYPWAIGIALIHIANIGAARRAPL